jgi:hypothetical protein
VEKCSRGYITKKAFTVLPVKASVFSVELTIQVFVGIGSFLNRECLAFGFQDIRPGFIEFLDRIFQDLDGFFKEMVSKTNYDAFSRE